MNISAYIMANRSQEVPIPTPGEEVQATITAGTYYVPYREVDQSSPVVETNKTNTYSPYKLSSSPNGVPVNFTAWGDFVTLYPDSSSAGVADCWIKPTKGSFTLTVGNLVPGNYVFEVVHFIGYNAYYWSGTPRKPSSKVEVNYNKTRVVKGGTHGAIDAELNPVQQEYQEVNPITNDYSTRTIETRVRYAFTIAQGDTTKTFSWGHGTDIDLAELWNTVQLISLNTSGQNAHTMGPWVNAHLYFHVAVYKDARG